MVKIWTVVAYLASAISGNHTIGPVVTGNQNFYWNEKDCIADAAMQQELRGGKVPHECIELTLKRRNNGG